MNAIIREAWIEDLDALVMLLHHLFSIETDFAVDENRQRRGLSMMLGGCRKHRCVKVAEVDGNVVGMCTAQRLISTAEGGPVALVEDLVVESQYRGLGIGRRLMAAIETWARQHNITRLQLLADGTNSSALDFYEKIEWRSTQLICLRRSWKRKQRGD